MFITYVVVAILLAAMLAMSGRGKLANDERITRPLTTVIGVPPKWFPFLAACEIAGALGLVAGIFFAPLGIAAAIGVVLYFLGAAVAHLRVGDTKGLAAPLPLLVVAAAALILRIASL